MKVPALGTKVTVIVHNDTSWMLVDMPQERTISGTVVKSAEWDADNTFRVFTGDPNNPTSVIPVSHVKSVTDGAGTTVKMTAVRMLDKGEPKIDAWQVTGSKGDIYTVTRTNDFWTCSCVGFQWKRNCGHIKKKQEELASKKASA
jgi:hypothetical protein